jgi:hypothetical protein
MLLAFVCSTSPVRAGADEATPGPQEAVPTAPVGANSPAAATLADVVLVGAAGENAALSELIEELLAEVAIAPHFSRVPALGGAQLLDQAARPSSGRARVWVILSRPTLARLLFAGPDRERYLVREVPLRSGLDELGRERIAQVLQSALLSLLRGDPGMTRAQLRVVVERSEDAATGGAPAGPASPAASRAEPQRPQAPATRPAALPRFGLGYAAAWTGPTMGARHGPLLSLGLDRIGATAFQVGLTLERDLDQTYESAEVGVSTQTTAVRFLLGGQWPLGGSVGGYARAGAGLDATRVTPTPVRESTVQLRGASTDVTAVSRVEVGVTFEVGSFILDAGPRLDLSPHDTHYDLADDGHVRRIATPSPALPGVQLTGSWRPSRRRAPSVADSRAGSGSTLASRDTDSP